MLLLDDDDDEELQLDDVLVRLTLRPVAIGRDDNRGYKGKRYKR